MKCQLLFVATVCLASVWALPVPDEEVAIQPDGGSKAELLTKTVLTTVAEPASLKPELEKVPEVKAAAPAEITPSQATEPAKEIIASGVELKASAPDVETAPAIPEKKTLPELEVPKPQEIPVEAEKKQEKTARTETEVKPTETQSQSQAIKAIELAPEAPAANAEVQKQVVDEVKPQEPKIDAKSAEEPAVVPVEKETAAVPEQPARQERINEIEQKEAKKETIATEEPAKPIEAAATPEPAKSETNIQVIAPEKKSIESVPAAAAPASAPAASPAAQAAQAKSGEAPKPVEQQKNTEIVAESAPVLKTNAPLAPAGATKVTEPLKEQPAVETIPAKSLPEEKKTEEEVVAPIAVPEPTAAVPEAKKIDEEPIAEQSNAPAAAPLAEQPKKSSEEKGDKSESKADDSSESKESEESSESKEN
ncbi:protein bangles and beads [Drosophila gunungcola]|uniref:Protein bangles and beads n=1 Tax=Drosophila gunungcola TaxID=103775 RepID=A0A9P9YCT9_9MUSC|nr:protein bangles and beads [Drosophila gunungcola]KAI8034556.1 hypothetical protein M5D96_012609 [Drosophila gunungcola]